MSWCVTAKYSFTLSTSNVASARMRRAASTGISPAAARASQTAISTSSQRSNFACSLQRAAISGRE